jgi:outer membrane protein TolC
MAASAGLTYSDQLFTSAPPQVIDLSGIGAGVINLGAPSEWYTTLGVTASLNLNMANIYNLRRIQADYRAGQLTYEQAILMLERDVKKSFYGLLAIRSSLAVLQKNIEITEKRYEQARANYRNGLLPEVDLLQIQVALETLRPTYDKALAGYNYSLMLFKFILGLDPEQEAEIQGVLETEFYDLDSGILVDHYLANNLDLQILELSIQSLEMAKGSTAMSMRTPTFGLSANYGTQVYEPGNPDSWESGTLQDNFSMSFILSIPLDTFIPGSSGDSAIRTMNDEIEKLRLVRQQAYENTRIEIISLVDTLNITRKMIEAYELNLQVARRSYRLTEEAYRMGTKELLDVDTAQKDMIQAEQSLLEEKYNYISGLLDLEYSLNTTAEQMAGGEEE